MTDETKTVRLRDLRTLGKQGGVTARLDDGSELLLMPNYALKKANGYVDGRLREVEFHLSYKSIYSQIRTIKKDSQLVARKVRSPAGFELRITGKGYRPPFNATNKKKGI